MSDVPRQDALPFSTDVPTEVEQLLGLLGWVKHGGVDGAFSAWRREGVEAEALAPQDREAGDWEFMTSDILQLLRRVHGGSAVERAVVGVRLGQSDLEETRWHRGSDASNAGIISWPEGEVFHASIRNQLMAAAKAHRDPRPYFGSARNYVAQDFISKSYLGQSDVGSYVLTALTPRSRLIYAATPPESSSSASKLTPAYAGGEIIRTFDRAVAIVGEILGEGRASDQVQALFHAVGEGVSFELLTALATFVGAEDASIEIRRRDLQTGDRVEREIVFPAGSGITLNEAAEGLARVPESTSTTVQGIVTLIEHDPQKDRIVRVFDPKGPWHRVRVVLDAAQYERALRAALSDDLVRVTGSVVRSGRYNWIYEPEHFDVLEVGATDDLPTLFETMAESMDDPRPNSLTTE